MTPRSDGLTWICPDDYMPDGRHPSDPVGREKAGHLILDFFKSDETTTPWFLTTESPPAAPSNLVATAIGTDRIRLNWTDGSDNEMGFKLERKSQGIPFQEVATIGPGITTYLDTALIAGTKYVYRTRAYNGAGTSLYSNKASSTTLSSEQAGSTLTAYPNPFNPTTTFRFSLSEPAWVSLKVYDVLGQELATIVDEPKETGRWQFEWDAHDGAEREVASGVYIALLRIGHVVSSMKIMLVR